MPDSYADGLTEHCGKEHLQLSQEIYLQHDSEYLYLLLTHLWAIVPRLYVSENSIGGKKEDFPLFFHRYLFQKLFKRCEQAPSSERHPFNLRLELQEPTSANKTFKCLCKALLHGAVQFKK